MKELKHLKHPKLERSSKGDYHRCEWAVYGTNCDNIASFYKLLSEAIANLAYVDADHSNHNKCFYLNNKEIQVLKPDEQKWNSFDDRLMDLSCKAVFVNGNHFPATRQVVFVDAKKKDSLERRKDQLDRIDLVIVKESEAEIFDFVKARMDENTSVLKLEEVDHQIQFFKKEIKQSFAVVKAVVLAGGKSLRMGEDKSALVYHEGKSQQIYMADLCQSLGLDTYLSKGHSEVEDKIGDYKIIKDRFVQLGPQGAILSAFMTDPNAAWLVVACDLPLINRALLKELLQKRDASKLATAFKQNETSFPEPLITIYEPAIYKRMLGFLSLGYSCPRKVLINSEVKEIIIKDESLLANANTPEERENLMTQING